MGSPACGGGTQGAIFINFPDKEAKMQYNGQKNHLLSKVPGFPNLPTGKKLAAAFLW